MTPKTLKDSTPNDARGKTAPNRRAFVTRASAGALGLLAVTPSAAAASSSTAQHQHARAMPESVADASDFSHYSRYTPSFGGPPDSPNYLGKLTPGRGGSGLQPVEVTAPDIPKLPWKIVNGAKEFEIVCQPVKREFLPGYWMDLWSYNGNMPGPTIEAYQGDRVRFVVHNKLPEPTSIHWHGLELPISQDGIPGVTQDAIQPGDTFVYEFDLHQTGTFFYHSHIAMQEPLGMVGFFIIHPHIAYNPPVDRDFALCFQNFFIPPNSTIPDTQRMDWNWHTINGRSGPYTTPLVCKHGERVRIRILDFSPMQHHPVHIHGHTFWVTGTEGGRVPEHAWLPGNNVLVGVAVARDIEFVAFNIGDWLMHCHMVHHMMNHMVSQVGPRVRNDRSVDAYLDSLDSPPEVRLTKDDARFDIPGYPQGMKHGVMGGAEETQKLLGRREVRGMRSGWYTGVQGLMTVVRVLPDELFEQVMGSDEPVEPGSSVPGSKPPGRHAHKDTG